MITILYLDRSTTGSLFFLECFGDGGGESSKKRDFLIVRPKEEVRGGRGREGDSEVGGMGVLRFLFSGAGATITVSEEERGLEDGEIVGEGVTLGDGGGESGIFNTLASIKNNNNNMFKRMSCKDTNGISLAECPFLQVQLDESGKREIDS